MTEKEKYLASAQKSVLKGNFDRAIKDYEQLVALDPQDLRLRQRLAELLIRVNRKDEAIREFETIGKYYSDNAYYLKSIAVFKQIQKLTPLNMAVSLQLADLNERQGLKGNALAEYQLVVLAYERAGEYGDAARVLDKMVALDPDNVAIHLKLAEVNYQANFRERSYREFLRSAILYNQNHDNAGFSRVCERFREIFPERTDFFVEVAREMVRNGQADEAVLFLQALLERDGTNLAAWFLLAETYDACNDWENVKDTYGRITVLFPNDLGAREKLISCLIAEADGAEALTQLESCLNFFPSEQATSFEKYFLQVAELTPFNLRPLLGLRELYEKSGALDKLAEVEVKLEHLRKSRAGEIDESPDEYFLPGEPVPEPAEPDAEDASPSPGTSAGAEPESTEVAAEDEPDSVEVATGDEPVSVEVATGDEWEEAEYGDVTVPEEPAEEVSIDVPFSWEEEVDLSLEDEIAAAGLEAGVDSAGPEKVTDGDFAATGTGTAITDALVTVSDDEYPAAGQESMIPEAPSPPVDLSGIPENDEAFDLEFSLDRESPPFEEIDFTEVVIDAAPEQTAPDMPFLPGNVPGGLFAAFDPDRQRDLAPEDISSGPEAVPVSPKPSGKYSIDGQFSEFKKGLDRQIDREDTEAHYNLGIAYKEMGLYSDAIEEFRIASRTPRRRIDALLLQGVCYRESGDTGRARDLLLSVLEGEELRPVESASILYELALLSEGEGDRAGTCRFLREIQETLPGFRDVVARMTSLGCAPADIVEDVVEAELEELED